jgi:hypothetical protein
MRLPPKKRPGNPILASDWNALIEALEARTPRPSAGLELIWVSGGFAYRVRQMAGGGETSSASASIRPFGEIITWQDGETKKTGIRGGTIICGDQNWNIDPQSVNPEADGIWLVSIAVTAEVNRDDDNEILLPGVKTGTKPTGDWTKTTWNEGTDYPENEAPQVSTGEGTIILPIGKLTIADGAVRLEPTGSGGFTINHCAGTLGFNRT